MSPLSRAARYVKAYMGIGELNRLTASLIDRPEEMLAETVKYCDAFLHPFQVPEELVRLMEDVKKLNPQTVLEIGTHRGGTLYLWARLARPDAILVSIDLPGGKFGGGYSPFRAPIYRRFAQDHLAHAGHDHFRASSQKLLRGISACRLDASPSSCAAESPGVLQQAHECDTRHSIAFQWSLSLIGECWNRYLSSG